MPNVAVVRLGDLANEPDYHNGRYDDYRVGNDSHKCVGAEGTFKQPADVVGHLSRQHPAYQDADCGEDRADETGLHAP